jgi:hypothetical protein
MSDGYDNKGCDPGNPAKPSAVQATGMLPAGLRVYSCAMGPTADQALLEQIATTTGGRYYFMPTIDDLFEIYNYIRGQVTGDGVIVNESGTASTRRIAAVVDRLAKRATFTVAWADKALKLVPREPRRRKEIAIRLRDPGGRLLHPDDSRVRHTVGDGYAVFDVPEAAPGRWHVEIATLEGVHTRYTVGGFVDSPLRLALRAPSSIAAGSPLDVAVRVLVNKRAITGLVPRARAAAPRRGVDRLLSELKDQLAQVRPPKVPGGDTVPKPLAQLVTLRDQLLDKGESDIFARAARKMAMKPQPGDPRVFTGRMPHTGERGSHNVVVTVTGSAPAAGRYIRKELASVLVR